MDLIALRLELLKLTYRKDAHPDISVESAKILEEYVAQTEQRKPATNRGELKSDVTVIRKTGNQ